MRPPLESTKDERRELHREKMRNKRARNARNYQRAVGQIGGWFMRLTGGPASINRHTGKPHEHAREIARRQRQGAV